MDVQEIWVFAGHTGLIVGLSYAGEFGNSIYRQNSKVVSNYLRYQHLKGIDPLSVAATLQKLYFLPSEKVSTPKEIICSRFRKDSLLKIRGVSI